MRYLMIGIAALGLLAPELVMAQDRVVRSFSIAKIGELMGMMGGTVGAAQAGQEEGDIEAVLTYASGDTAQIVARNCEPGSSLVERVCSHFILLKTFQMKDARTAAAFSAGFDAPWYADTAYGNTFEIRRMDWISNGVTTAHLGSTLGEFSEGIRKLKPEVEMANGR